MYLYSFFDRFFYSGIFHSSSSVVSLHRRTVIDYSSLLQHLHHRTFQHPGELNTSAIKNVDIKTSLHVCVPELLPLEEKAVYYWMRS